MEEISHFIRISIIVFKNKYSNILSFALYYFYNNDMAVNKLKKLLLLLFSCFLILGACGKDYSVNDVTDQFKKDGLKVQNLHKMSHEDFGLAPMKAEEAKMFTVEDKKNGRIMKFKNEDDLKDTKKYYDDLGKSSAAFYSHTYAKDNFLIQMNGEIKEDVFNKYKDAINKVLEQ